jgi:hypothetical protein
MIKLRFLKPVVLSVIETKNIDGQLIINEFEETMTVNKMIHIIEIFKTDNISLINFQTEVDNTIRLYQNADLTMFTIHYTDGPPQSMEPSNSPPPSSPCGCH